MSREPAVRDPYLDELRRQYAPDATDLELRHFADAARSVELKPAAGHVALVRYGNSHRPLITVAGRRHIAHRTGRLRGIDRIEWCPPRRYDAQGQRLPLEWLEVWDSEEEAPYAARCLVWVADWTVPANGTVKWSEFGAEKARKPGPWATMPAHMLGKAAEALALRRGFTEVDAAVASVNGAGADDSDLDLVVEAAAEEPDRLGELPSADNPPASESMVIKLQRRIDALDPATRARLREAAVRHRLPNIKSARFTVTHVAMLDALLDEVEEGPIVAPGGAEPPSSHPPEEASGARRAERKPAAGGDTSSPGSDPAVERARGPGDSPDPGETAEGQRRIREGHAELRRIREAEAEARDDAPESTWGPDDPERPFDE